jgi:hypothetical protein
MATIIVENGTVVAGANSYVSEADLTAYASDRGLTLTAATDALIIKAMDYIESLSFIGDKHKESQPLQWPRDEVYIDRYYIERETIPKELKNGVYTAALAIDAELDPLRIIERATKREKMDVIEVEYADSAASQTIVRTISAALYKILRPGGHGSSAFRVVRV